MLFGIAALTSCGKNGANNGSSSLQVSTQPSAQINDPLKYVELVSPDSHLIRTSIAYTATAQTKGLQGVQNSQFADDEGKLFFYLKTSARSFWMPNTFFNLDLIYLDQNMKILDIVWNLPHYNGNVNSEIPRAPVINSRHVLEMKSGSPISSKLKVGDTLQWKSSLPLQQTELKIQTIIR